VDAQPCHQQACRQALRPPSAVATPLAIERVVRRCGNQRDMSNILFRQEEPLSADDVHVRECIICTNDRVRWSQSMKNKLGILLFAFGVRHHLQQINAISCVGGTLVHHSKPEHNLRCRAFCKHFSPWRHMRLVKVDSLPHIRLENR
jgi:hypothetical protein